MANLFRTETLASYPDTSPEAAIVPILFSRELAAAAASDVVYLAQVTRGLTALGLNYKTDALGATNGLTFKLINQASGATVATLATVRNEMGGWRYAFGVVLFQTILAWIVAFLVYQIGGLIL